MGHIINPITTRLGLNTFWSSRWAINNLNNYNKLFRENNFFFQFVTYFFQKKIMTKKNILFSHYFFYLNSNNDVYLNIHYFMEGFYKQRSTAHFADIFKLIRKKRKIQIPYKSLLRKYSAFSQNRLLFTYWFLIKYYWNSYIKNSKNWIKKLYINFLNLTFDHVDAHVILKYIRLRLISKYSLNYILKPILRDLHIRMKNQKILGYKILCAGRFTRKQIAAKMWYKQGPTSVNNFENLIKYSQIKVRLKYGVCGIKMWINYGGPTTDRFVQKSYVTTPFLKWFIFRQISTSQSKISLFLNSTSLNYLRISFLKKKSVYNYIQYTQKIIFNKLYTILIKRLLKEIRIFFKYRSIKSLRYLPFITLIKNNSRIINIQFNYKRLFIMNQTKYFTYK